MWWCQDNTTTLLLNASKVKDLRRTFGNNLERNYAPFKINRSSVETVDSFEYLSVHITKGLTWVRVRVRGVTYRLDGEKGLRKV